MRHALDSTSEATSKALTPASTRASMMTERVVGLGGVEHPAGEVGEKPIAARRAACGLSARTGRSGWRSRRRSTAEVKTSIPCLPTRLMAYAKILSAVLTGGCTSVFLSPPKRDSGAVRDPDVRLLIGAALAIEVDFDRRQCPFKRVSARLLEACLRPVLPERDGFMHDHGAFARPN